MTGTRMVFIAACAGMLLFGMVMLSLGTVNTFLVDRFRLDPIEVGSLAGLLPFGILAGSVIFGPVVDRYGYKIPLTVAALLISVAFEVIALAAAFLPVQAAFFVIGLGGGVLNGGTNALVADISDGNRESRLSILGVFFGLGALGMPLVTALVLRWFIPSEIVTGFGLLVLLSVVFFLFVAFPAPKQAQGFPLREGAALVRDTTLLLLSMILFFESAAEGLVNNWTPAFLQKARGLGTDESLYMLTLVLASLSVARLVLGGLLTRVSRAKVLVCSLGLAVLGTALFIAAPGVSAVTVAVVLIGAGFAAVFPVVLGTIGDLFPQLSGTAFGVALVIGLAGNAIVNTVLGIASASWGIGIFPWYLLFILAGLGLFLALSIRSLADRPSASKG
jgi:FHS family glucose/mannose:H+ symporter-like MFS transporter